MAVGALRFGYSSCAGKLGPTAKVWAGFSKRGSDYSRLKVVSVKMQNKMEAALLTFRGILIIQLSSVSERFI